MPFEMTIDGVFDISGRGPCVAGPIEAGTVCDGDLIAFWDGDRLVATVRVSVESVRKLERTLGPSL